MQVVDDPVQRVKGEVVRDETTGYPEYGPTTTTTERVRGASSLPELSLRMKTRMLSKTDFKDYKKNVSVTAIPLHYASHYTWKLGRNEILVEGDGHCLFRAMATAVAHDQGSGVPDSLITRPNPCPAESRQSSDTKRKSAPDGSERTARNKKNQGGDSDVTGTSCDLTHVLQKVASRRTQRGNQHRMEVGGLHATRKTGEVILM